MLHRHVLAGFSALLVPLVLPVLPVLAEAAPKPLSQDAQILVRRAFGDLGGRQPVDYHVHILGLGAEGSGAYASPKLLSWSHPLSRLKARTIFRSSGVTDEAQADPQYLARLLDLSRQFPASPKLAILAFDYHYAKDGSIDYARSEFHIPNEYVLQLAARYPERFIPVASVHPYDPQALHRLEACARAGVTLVKWLPNAQGMDPSDPDIDAFYRAMARHGMALLCHTGLESSVQSDAQRLGNPLLLRRPLDLGVTVIMAHAGNRGMSDDLDNPGRKARNFDLFLRMMDDPTYRDHLYADISMLTQMLRNPRDLTTLLARADLHHRLVNGSDYPLPAIDVIIQPRLLARHGFISASERRSLTEIYRRNPLLFDFVLKRTLRLPETGAQFPPDMFVAHPGLARNSIREPRNVHTAEGE